MENTTIKKSELEQMIQEGLQEVVGEMIQENRSWDDTRYMYFMRALDQISTKYGIVINGNFSQYDPHDIKIVRYVKDSSSGDINPRISFNPDADTEQSY